MGSEDYNFHGKTNVEVASASAGLTAGIDGVGLEAEAVGAKAEVDGGFTIGGINFDVEVVLAHKLEVRLKQVQEELK